jgi:hypothetical protein
VSLLQGLANYASAQGFGIAFHLVTATTVANMIVDITKRHYKAFCKKNPEAKAVPFSVSHIAGSLMYLTNIRRTMTRLTSISLAGLSSRLT